LINYNAEKTFPVPSKISHVAFDAAEEHLIVGAEAGGVAVYSLSDVINSGSQPAAVAELSLGGELREVRPNPAVESSKYVAICTANGDLRMLDLETKGFVNNAILATNISTICWSQRGKQIICGKFDGTCVQLTPSGEEKATIPCVPGLENAFGENS
jgi:nucleoporin NUP159